MGSIDHLEQLELVERKSNPSDRRSHAVTLTAKGQEYLNQATEFARNAESEFFAPLSAEERQQLHSLLARLLQ